MDLEHPMIRDIQRIGYPSVEYLEFEREEDLKGGEEDGERTPDEESADC